MTHLWKMSDAFIYPVNRKKSSFLGDQYFYNIYDVFTGDILDSVYLKMCKWTNEKTTVRKRSINMYQIFACAEFTRCLQYCDWLIPKVLCIIMTKSSWKQYLGCSTYLVLTSKQQSGIMSLKFLCESVLSQILMCAIYFPTQNVTFSKSQNNVQLEIKYITSLICT